MNTLIKYGLSICLLLSEIDSHAQVSTKSDADDNKKDETQLSVRAQSLYDTQDASDADIPWMRVLYRQIDLTKEKNMPLYRQIANSRASAAIVPQNSNVRCIPFHRSSSSPAP